jgi:hypothetical protein
MKPAMTRIILVLFALSALTAVVLGEPQSQSLLGKIDFQALYSAAPPLPASPAEAATRAYGRSLADQNTAALDTFYTPFRNRVASARETIKPAVDALPAHREAMAQRLTTQANDSAIIAGMGGTDKISEMSEEEAQQAAMKAVGDTMRAQSGGHGDAARGTQAIMQRVMNDPAYRERFEKMTPAEQEAEMRKAMGPTAVVAEHTAAEEKHSMQASNEASAVMSRNNELNAIFQKMVVVDQEFVAKDAAITTAPGGFNKINDDINAKIKNIPLVDGGEMGQVPDPGKYRAVMIEKVTLSRNRAAWELQQRAALYTRRRAAYKQLASEYSAWLKQNPPRATGTTAQVMEDSSLETAVRCEEELIGMAERLAKYSEDSTTNAAQHEAQYQKTLAER